MTCFSSSYTTIQLEDRIEDEDISNKSTHYETTKEGILLRC